LVVLLFGPPGCGKGTQAGFIAKRFQIPAISTGEMFRAECTAGTELGRKTAAILACGGLVGDDIVNGMVARRIHGEDCAQGFLLDGYPRTVPQAKAFTRLLGDRGLPAATVIHLDVPNSVLVRRLTARRQCPRCQRIYNLLSQAPRQPGFCDADGTALITREDDQEAVIRQRLRAYEKQTGPVLKWYGAAKVHRIEADRQPAEVAEAIERVLARNFRPQPGRTALGTQRLASALRP
jgi:adenylate kinase